MRKSRWLVALLLILAAGCGNNPHPSDDNGRAIVYLPLPADIKTLDPSVCYTDIESWIVDPVCPSFYRYHYLHPTPPFVLELCLGAAPPVRRALPDGGEEWSFTIRRDLRFQDDPCFPGGKGRSIDAHDFIYSFQRIADPRVGSPVASFFADKVVGWADFAKAFARDGDAAYARKLPGVTVDRSDPFTFRIRLNQPFPQLRYLMAMHFTTPQAREAVARYGADYARHPVGCGPMRLREYLPRQRVVLERSPGAPRYLFPSDPASGTEAVGRRADAGKPLPLADRVVFDIVPEATTQWTLFQQGYLDAVAISALNIQTAPLVSERLAPAFRRSGARLQSGRLISVDYLAFNMDDPLWGGLTARARRLRQAVSLAVDADEFVDLGLRGAGTPAQWLLPLGVAGHDPAYRNPLRRVDLERAKRLLAEAGFAGGVDPATGRKLTLTLDSGADTQGLKDQASLLRRQIERIGIHVELRLSLSSQFQDRIQKGQHQMIQWGWFADYPDAENFLLLLYGPNRVPGPNSANYRNPAYDRLFEKMRALDDGPVRRNLVAQMRDLSTNDCPWIPLTHSRSFLMTQSWLHNASPHPLANNFVLYYRVDTALRDARRASGNRPKVAPLLLTVAVLGLGILPAAATVRRHRRRRVRVERGGEPSP